MEKYETIEVVEEKEEEEKIYVAVSKEIKENKCLLTWALQSFRGKRICVIHVHRPAKRIPTPLGYMLASSLAEKEVEAYRDKERDKMFTILDEYIHICHKSLEVKIEKLYIETNSVEEGIIQLVEDHGIKNLVMRAAADKHYSSKKMAEVRSKKARYVRDNAPPYCRIWFICSGYLIQTREATSASTRSSVGERSVVVGGPRWSVDSLDGSIPSPMYPHSISSTEFGNVSELESLYIEECERRKEAEMELAKVKAELEWMKTHVANMPKEKDESKTIELGKAKAELEYIKYKILAELRMAVEQKELLQNQIGNFTFLLQVIGEKLASAIDVVHKYDDLTRDTSSVNREFIIGYDNKSFGKLLLRVLGYLLLVYMFIQILKATFSYKQNNLFYS